MYRCFKCRWKLLFPICLAACICFASITVYALSEEESAAQPKVRLPIIMYHSILKTASRTGKFVVTPETLESDLRYIKDKGYTTVLIRDVIDYVKNDKPLPDKPIVITLDDGFLNNKTYLLPLLEELDMKAVISIVGSYSEKYSSLNDPNPNYAHLTWQDTKELAATGRIEIGNHTYNMHSQSPRRGCMRKRGESVEHYQEALREDLSKTQELLRQNAGVTPAVFAYPYGYISKEALPVLKELGFESAMTCYEKVNTITKDPECLYHLNRFNRPGSMSTKKFMSRLLQ